MRRLLDRLAPVRPAGSVTGYRRILSWAALPVTNRRWAAPLCALALGFGLFAGVAIGPGTPGSLATGAPSVIEIPSLLSSEEGVAEEGTEAEAESGGFAASSGGSGGGEEESSFPSEASSSEFIPSFSEVEAPESPEPSESTAAPKESSPKAEAEPEVEETQLASGVVVHVNPAAGSYTVVESGGLLNAVHAAKLPEPGTQVSVLVSTLANGTFAEAGPRKQTGRKTQASFAGIVTFVNPDPAAPAYTVSKRGVSALVHVHPDPTGAPVQLPQLGAYATVAVDIEKAPPASEAVPPAATETVPPDPTCAPDPTKAPVAAPAPVALLWQRQLDADGAPFASSDFEGVVMAVCATEGRLLLSADDLRESGKDLLLAVPKSIDTSKLVAGDSVLATATIEAGGTLNLTGLASDERSKGADDAATAQGDLVSHQPR